MSYDMREGYSVMKQREKVGILRVYFCLNIFVIKSPLKHCINAESNVHYRCSKISLIWRIFNNVSYESLQCSLGRVTDAETSALICRFSLYSNAWLTQFPFHRRYFDIQYTKTLLSKISHGYALTNWPKF